MNRTSPSRIFMSIVNLCPSSALTKSEKINEEKDQTYWIRKAEELEATTVHEYADHIHPHQLQLNYCCRSYPTPLILNRPPV